MIERFTVDKLADAIEEQVKGAHPKPKLLRRFFCAGKRDGKRGRESEPVRFYLTEGVSIATSRIAEEFVAVRAEKNKTLEQIKSRLSNHKGASALEGHQQQAGERAEANVPDANPPSDEVQAQPNSGDMASDDDLTNALNALGKARADAAAARAAADAEQQRAEAASIVEQRAVIESELGSLRDQYLQLVESAHSVGRFLWARYCNGFVHGEARARNETQPTTPSPDISFAIPHVLSPHGDEQTITVGGPGDPVDAPVPPEG